MTKRDVFWQHDLSISYKLIGDVLHAQGNLSESIVASKRDLAVSHRKVAMVLARQGERKRALSAFRQGREIIVKLKAARNGGDLTRRFPRIAEAVLGLTAKSCIIDGELIAAGAHGEPDFLALLHGRHVPTCDYAFDLLELQAATFAIKHSCNGARGCERC